MPPVIRRDLARIDSGRLDGIDQAENPCDLGPPMNMEKELAAGIYLGDRREWFTCTNRPDNIERRAQGAICIGYPSHQAEQLTRRIALGPLPAVQYPAGDRLAEPEPVFAFAFAPHQRDMRQLRAIALCIVFLSIVSLRTIPLRSFAGSRNSLTVFCPQRRLR